MTERNSKILLVDVPKRIRKLFESQRTAYSIIVSETTSRALELVGEGNIKLCVLSDNLPGMDMFIREVRNTPLASELPLLVITSNRTHEELFKLGADAFFGTTESDEKFLEKIELLLGLGDSNISNVFVKRNETENPFYFLVQYASQMVGDMETVTLGEHSRSLPDEQSLHSLIQSVEKDVRGSDRHQIATEYTEGLEAVDPQGYIGQQLSVGERLEVNLSDGTFKTKFETLSSSGDGTKSVNAGISFQKDVHIVNNPSIGAIPNLQESDDNDAQDTRISPKALKHQIGGVDISAPLEGNTLSQPFSILERSTRLKTQEVLAANIRTADYHPWSPQRKTSAPELSSKEECKVETRLSSNEPQNSLSASDLVSESSYMARHFVSQKDERSIALEKNSRSMLVDSGELVTRPVWWIFKHIMEAAFSGILVVTRGNHKRIFYFDSGELMVVSSNAREDRLVELLYREGRISEQQYETASMTIAASGRRAGVIMVDKGIITSRELFPVVRYHYENMMYDTFGWTAGEWHLTAGQYNLNERIVLDTPLAALILEAFRTVVPAELITEIVHESNPQKEENVASDYLDGLNLARLEREFIDLSDGTHSVTWIAHRLGMNTTELRALAGGLTVLGVLQPPNPDSTAEGAEQPVRKTLMLTPEIVVPEFTEETVNTKLLDEKLAQVTEGTYFDIAEVAEDASPLEIRQSIQRLKSLYSINRFSGMKIADLQEKLRTIGSILDEALDVLLNDEIRDGYRKAVQKMTTVE